MQLLNDFAAIGHGIAALAPEDVHILQAGAVQAGAARAVLGAGTGLGVGFLFPCGEDEIVVPSEGGNVDFSPGTEMEIELLRFLRQRYGQVCVERVVSGPGLANIYAFVCEYEQHQPVLLESADPPAAIAEAAQSNTDIAACHALAMFVRAYGAFAGDLALLSLSHGGVYIAGGIAAKLATQMAQGGFIAGAVVWQAPHLARLLTLGFFQWRAATSLCSDLNRRVSVMRSNGLSDNSCFPVSAFFSRNAVISWTDAASRLASLPKCLASPDMIARHDSAGSRPGG